MSAPNDKPAATEQTGRLLEMIHAGWTTQVLCCAVQLGLPDRLSSGVRSVAKLAADLNCNPEALRRLLRGLASLAIVTERGSDGYTLAPLGQRLRSDVPDSLCAQAEWFGRYAWPLWGELADSVRTGLSSRERRLGQNGYVHLDADRAAARVFNLAMVQLTRLVATSVASALDFTEVRRFVDIGGGYGELLVACLAANPRANGILLEMAHAVPGGQQHLDQAGLGDRAVAQEGNFFADIPPGADVYLLKAVLHNWDDTQCGAILANVRRAMPAQARVVIVERVLPDSIEICAAHQSVTRSDLNMLVGLGGRERTRGEFIALLASAGFAAPQFRPGAAGFCSIESYGA